MKKMTGPKAIPIGQIKIPFFVRENLNDDLVLQYAENYTAGVKMPPIVINANSELIDGRHRLEGQKLIERTSVMCLIDDSTSRIENITEAIKANLGGSLPPTSADMEHSIELLINEGMKHYQIKTLFPLPPSTIQRYIDNVRRRAYNRKIGLAIESVAERGWTIVRASEHYGVKEDELKTRIMGRKKRKNGPIDSFSAGVEFRTRGYSQYIRGCLSKLRKEVVDGNLTRAEFDAFAERCRKSAKGIMKTIETNQERMNSAAGLTEVGDE